MTIKIAALGGSKMPLAPPLAYDALMRRIAEGYLTTAEELRAYLAKKASADADFTDKLFPLDSLAEEPVWAF